MAAARPVPGAGGFDLRPYPGAGHEHPAGRRCRTGNRRQPARSQPLRRAACRRSAGSGRPRRRHADAGGERATAGESRSPTPSGRPAAGATPFGQPAAVTCRSASPVGQPPTARSSQGQGASSSPSSRRPCRRSSAGGRLLRRARLGDAGHGRCNRPSRSSRPACAPAAGLVWPVRMADSRPLPRGRPPCARTAVPAHRRPRSARAAETHLAVGAAPEPGRARRGRLMGGARRAHARRLAESAAGPRVTMAGRDAAWRLADRSGRGHRTRSPGPARAAGPGVATRHGRRPRDPASTTPPAPCSTRCACPPRSRCRAS